MNIIDKRYYGDSGEDIAERYLRKNKYKILERNFSVRSGEIDIIARKGKVYVIVEVKRRFNADFIRPSEAVNDEKQRRICSAAWCYISKHNLERADVRFDIIEIVGSELNHIENAFESKISF